MHCITGWVEVQWDHGGANSYRMGAEGKYDLDLTGEEPLVPPPPSSEEQAAVEEEVCGDHKHSLCLLCTCFILTLFPCC